MQRRPEIAAFLIAYGANFEGVKSNTGVLLLNQELSGMFPEDTILRAMVRCMPSLPAVDYQRVHGIHSAHNRNADILEKLREKYQWYCSLRNKPRTLQHYSRCVVRSALGPQRLRKIRTLPLPRPLQEYLLLDFDTVTGSHLPEDLFRDNLVERGSSMIK